MANVEVSMGKDDARIVDYILVEDINLSGAPADGIHLGTVNIPLGTIIEVAHISIVTTISGDTVTQFSVGLEDDSNLFTDGVVTDLTAGSSVFSCQAVSNGVKLFANAGDYATAQRIALKTENGGGPAATTAGIVRVKLYGRHFTS